LINLTRQEGRFLITVIKEEGALPEVIVTDIWRILPQKMKVANAFIYRCPQCDAEIKWLPNMPTPTYCYNCGNSLSIDYQNTEDKPVVIDAQGSMFERHKNGGK